MTSSLNEYQDAVSRHIAEQEGRGVFDYNIYRHPPAMDVKIDNFTPSKLKRWS